MTSKFSELVKNKETALVYHGAKGETVILSEKQPHRNTERLFEYFSPVEKFMLECALDSNCECQLQMDAYVCEVTTISGHGVAAIAPARCGDTRDDDAYDWFSRLAGLEFDSEYDMGFLFADEVLSRIVPDLCRIYSDMEFEFAVKDLRSELLDLSLPNLIRICMLCAGIADTVSSDRRMEIKLDSTKEELKLTFLTGCEPNSYREETADTLVDLARFVCEREGGKFEIFREKGVLEINFVFRSQPDEIPEFKFRDQFSGYSEYFSKVEREIDALRAEEQSQH